MATSFLCQIPLIVDLLGQIPARRVLDVGKGFGKYGFLAHEYVGIDNKVRPNPARMLREESRLCIDAVESNRDYLWPHIDQLYTNVYVGRIEELVATLADYELVLMLDVIEHLPKTTGEYVLKTFLSRGAVVIISTPKNFFQQHLYGSCDEQHVSYWTPRDRVFVLSSRPLQFRAFGRSPYKRAKRIAHALIDELT
jgi:hypothetical protein